MIGVDPRPLTLRELAWMLEGRQADAYQGHAILAGIFNRLGSGRGSPLTIEPPAWLRQGKQSARAAREELAMAREVFKAGIGKR